MIELVMPVKAVDPYLLLFGWPARLHRAQVAYNLWLEFWNRVLHLRTPRCRSYDLERYSAADACR